MTAPALASGTRSPGTRRWVAYGVLAVAILAFAAWAWSRVHGLSEDTQATNPIIRWEWLFTRERTPDELWTRTKQHLELTVVPVVLGTAIAAVLSAIALRFRWTVGPITTFAGFLYTIPSLALFGVLVTYNSNWTAAVIALTSYTLLILVRNMVAGIDGVPQAAIDAADGLGMGRVQRFFKVELPLALPVILTGIRVATVTTIGLVGISAVIQLGGVAYFIFDGYRREFTTEVVVGSGLAVLLAVGLDLLLRLVERLATPWSRRAGLR
ncbi:ABC transporter permease [Aquihabitans sp. G128]|uniref:ABC transporter permease n=1 Tax=Aquihabitans sp. G128 TaxID=2849779 RepID=UPI001C211DEC|nr:ABC transporter permease [Aquihabitans sp. G128]QXC63209.1 ABC transporter permease [Aquihabitans sp. G128]